MSADSVDSENKENDERAAHIKQLEDQLKAAENERDAVRYIEAFGARYGRSVPGRFLRYGCCFRDFIVLYVLLQYCIFDRRTIMRNVKKAMARGPEYGAHLFILISELHTSI